MSDRLRALARALKARCVQAWNQNPAHAQRAARRLRTLATRCAQAAVGPEVAALADWCDAVVAIIDGRLAPALQHLDAAHDALLALGLEDDAAQTRVPRIMVLSLLGRHDEAADCAEQAQRRLLALGNVAAAGRVSLNLGGLNLRQDAPAAAARHYRRASVLFARIDDAAHSITADLGQADALAAQGQGDEALRLYARAAMRAERRGLQLPVALARESTALVHLAQGRHADALRGLESAAEAYAALSLTHYQAIAERHQADALLALRLWPEALSLLDRVGQRLQALDLPDEQAAALLQKARVLALQGQHRPAVRALDEADALFLRQGRDTARAGVALSRAELTLAEGRIDEATALCREAGTNFTKAGLRAERALADELRARAALRAGRLDEAGRAWMSLRERARRLQLAPLQLACAIGLGQVARRRGRQALARRRLDDALKHLELQRRALPGDELRSAFLRDGLLAYDERLALALDLGDARGALALLERARARALADRMQGAAAPEDGESVQQLRRRLQWRARRVQREDDEGGASAAAWQALRAAEQALLRALRQQQQEQPATRPRAHTADIDALRRRLAPDEAVLCLAQVLGEWVAWVLRADGLRVHRALVPPAGLADALQALRFQLGALRHGAAPVEAHLPQLTARAARRLQALAGLLMDPLAQDLAGVRRVLLVPDAALADLPWSALLPGRQVALVPSLDVALARWGDRAPRWERVLALGDSLRLPHAADEVAAVAQVHPGTQQALGDQATPAQLQAAAPGLDLLHLACHAHFRADNPRFSTLVLQRGTLSAFEVERLPLAGCVVVLSGCDTALADPGRGNEVQGLVRAFLLAGAHRVVATLWPVADEVAAAWAGPFHRALRAGSSLAAALDQAAQAVRARHPHPAQWAAFTVCGGW